MRLQIVPSHLATLHDLLQDSGALILDGRQIRDMYRVGRHGCRVSRYMEKDLRARGVEIWPPFSIRSQHDVVLVHAEHAPPAQLDAMRVAVDLLRSRSPQVAALGHTSGVEGAAAMALYLSTKLRFSQRIAGPSAA